VEKALSKIHLSRIKRNGRVNINKSSVGGYKSRNVAQTFSNVLALVNPRLGGCNVSKFSCDFTNAISVSANESSVGGCKVGRNDLLERSIVFVSRRTQGWS
jgi:hypothetical protein